MSNKYCRDCAHVRDFDRESFEKCGATLEINVIRGEEKMDYCSTMRMTNGRCGPEGKLWEASEPTPQTDFAFEPVPTLAHEVETDAALARAISKCIFCAAEPDTAGIIIHGPECKLNKGWNRSYDKDVPQ